MSYLAALRSNPTARALGLLAKRAALEALPEERLRALVMGKLPVEKHAAVHRAPRGLVISMAIALEMTND